MTAPVLGGFAFAEDACRPAVRARLFWDARHDPSVLSVEAQQVCPDDQDVFDLSRFAALTTVVAGPDGGEHIAISDGYRRVRIDVVLGTVCNGPVRLRYLLQGISGIESKILTLRRLVALCRLGRFVQHLHPPERLAPRWIAALRTHDAICNGVSHREIAIALHGETFVDSNWGGGSDFLRLRLQRLVRAGRLMTADGYRTLLR